MLTKINIDDDYNLLELIDKILCLQPVSQTLAVDDIPVGGIRSASYGENYWIILFTYCGALKITFTLRTITRANVLSAIEQITPHLVARADWRRKQNDIER